MPKRNYASEIFESPYEPIVAGDLVRVGGFGLTASVLEANHRQGWARVRLGDGTEREVGMSGLSLVLDRTGGPPDAA